MRVALNFCSIYAQEKCRAGHHFKLTSENESGMFFWWIGIYHICPHFAPGQSDELGQAKTSNGYTWRRSNFPILLEQRHCFPAGYRFLRHGSALTSPTHLPETLWLKCMPRSISVTLSSSPSAHLPQKVSRQNIKVSLSRLSGGRQYLKKRHWKLSVSFLLSFREFINLEASYMSLPAPQFTVQKYGGRNGQYFLMITAPCASSLLWAPWPPHPAPDPAPNTTPACHAPPDRTAAAALLGLHSGPVRTVQVPGEYGWGLGVGALRVSAETRVNERLHADQGGSARNHVWKPTREVLHFGEFMLGLVMQLLYFYD